MKYLVLVLLFLTLSQQSFAESVCTGDTLSGKKVTVTVLTTGAYGMIEGGDVSIELPTNKKIEYNLNILQFFEDLYEDRVLVGLSAGDIGNDTNYVKIRYSSESDQNYLKVYNPEAPNRYIELRDFNCSVITDA